MKNILLFIVMMFVHIAVHAPNPEKERPAPDPEVAHPPAQQIMVPVPYGRPASTHSPEYQAAAVLLRSGAYREDMRVMPTIRALPDYAQDGLAWELFGVACAHCINRVCCQPYERCVEECLLLKGPALRCLFDNQDPAVPSSCVVLGLGIASSGLFYLWKISNSVPLEWAFGVPGVVCCACTYTSCMIRWMEACKPEPRHPIIINPPADGSPHGESSESEFEFDGTDSD